MSTSPTEKGMEMQPQGEGEQKPPEEESKEATEVEESKEEKEVPAEEKTPPEAGEEEQKKPMAKEGREVKPKKIPIGGIQMPGFFTRAKAKDKAKDVEKGEAEAPPGDADQPEAEGDAAKAPGRPHRRAVDWRALRLPPALLQRLRWPDAWRPRQAAPQENNTEKNDEKNDEKKDADEKKPAEAISRSRRLLESIRLPLSAVFPRRPKENGEPAAPQASTETLDEPDKELKEVPLEKADPEKNAPEEEPVWRAKLRTYRVAISTVLVFFLLLIIIVAFCLPGRRLYAAPLQDGKYVEAVTQCGYVRGALEDGAFAFRGIPYARPPVQALRWRPAQPLNTLEHCWNGTLAALQAAPECAQMYANGSIAGTEACLTLDVVTPHVRYDNPLPVVVMLGAESLVGGSPGKMRPSTRYARSRDVIFVRPNFRLGALGFLALKELSDDTHPPSSGNYGLTDIVAALQWVQLNIRHFGGDPALVTLFGHRAGATLVTALSSSRYAKKLFARSWATSGSVLFPGRPLPEAEAASRAFLDSVQCTNVQCLRAKSAEDVLNAVPDTWRKAAPDLPHANEDPEKKHQWLVLDGHVLYEHPATVWASDKGLQVQLVIGTTAHASATDTLYNRYTTWTPEIVARHVRDSMVPQVAQAGEEPSPMAMYPSTFKGLAGMISDIRTVCPLLAISAQQQKVPFYVVTQARGDLDLADVDSDVDAILGRYEPKSVEQRRYVSAMQQLFYYYVWHGEVKQEGAAFRGSRVLVVEQDVNPAANYSHCDYWISRNVVPKYAQID